MPETKTAEFANSGILDLGVVAQYEPQAADK